MINGPRSSAQIKPIASKQFFPVHRIRKMHFNQLHINTPLMQSVALSQYINGNVWLKIEAMQPSGSFKTRGIGLACREYIANGAERLVTSSGGNAGLAVAYAGRKYGVKTTVVVPETTTQKAIELIQAEQAEVIVEGASWDESHQYACNVQGGKCLHPSLRRSPRLEGTCDHDR